MEIICTRPGCSRPLNHFDDLDHSTTLKTTQQRYCQSCGMPLILGGRYLPLKLLGQGGFGAAFLACDRHTTKLRQCVVKQFQPSGQLQGKALEIAQELFEREATVLEEIGEKHEQIPDLYAFFPLIVKNQLTQQEEQYFYLVQELIDGENLEEELETKGKFSELEILDILDQVLPILAYIHGLGIIHRDIKPSNIMRDKQNKLYLLDFGAVKQVASVGTPNAHSTSIFSMGFAPPEQMRGGQVYPSTDLYALGTTCIHLLTGKPTEELFDDQRNTWKWRSHLPQIDDTLATVLDKLLETAPQDRYQSAEEVQNALEKGMISPQPPISSNTILQAPPTAQNIPIPTPPTPPSPPSPPSLPTPLTPPTPPTLSTPRPPRFSTLDMLKGAAFTGFEGMLFVIAGFSLLGQGGIIIAGMAIAGLIVAQFMKLIEGKDLPILAIITALLMLINPLHSGATSIMAMLTLTQLTTVQPLIGIFVLSLLTGVGLCLITTLFLLIYQGLRRIL